MNRKIMLFLTVLVLQLSGLACRTWVDEGELVQPTIAPTTQPPEETATMAPTASGPQTFTGEAAKNDFASDGAMCLVYQPVTLVVNTDGTAQLTTTGADIIDHVNCTAGTAEETWYINGLVDAATQTVNFQTCNFGNFTASGSLSFAQGVLAGDVSCTNKDGVKFIALIINQ